MLFTILNGPTITKAQDLLDQAIGKVDGVEIRLDTFTEITPSLFLPLIQKAASSGMKTLFTLRPKRQGGCFEGNEEDRLQLIEDFALLHPDFIDLEYDVSEAFRKKLSLTYPKLRLFSSYHNFEKTPSDLKAVLQGILSPYTHVYKIATYAQSTLDALRILHFMQKETAHHQLIGIGMGEEGSITRILAPVYGNYLSFALIDPEEQTAPGQFEINALIKTYHYRSLNRHTQIFGLLGSPVNKSLSHILHNAVLAQIGVNACYVKMPLKVEELSSFFPLIETLPFKGFSVTMPLKEAIVPFLEELSPAAQAIGAVNTIMIKEGKTIGHNTDGIGALEAIEQHTSVKGKKIVVVGAGGAAKAVAYEALNRGADVWILNRTESRAIHLTERFDCQGGGWDLFPKLFREGYHVLINCTPAGELIDPRWLIPGSYVMDIVSSQKTPLLLKAIKQGCHPISGREMLINQAIEQQLIWQGAHASRKQIRQIMQASLS